MGTVATVMVFIDIFIGIRGFTLAVIWRSVIERKPGERVRPDQIWERFPKFVIGYVITFMVVLFASIISPDSTEKTKAAMGEG